MSMSVASRSQRVSLIVIPFCLSGCLSVIPRPTAYHDWSITTRFGRTRVSLFGSLSPILSVPEEKICKISPFSNTSTMGHAKPYSSYNSWSSLLIFGHNTLHRHTHRLTSAFLICALMSRWQPFNAYSCHCERDTSCHMTCLSVCLPVCLFVCLRTFSETFSVHVVCGRGSVLLWRRGIGW